MIITSDLKFVCGKFFIKTDSVMLGCSRLVFSSLVMLTITYLNQVLKAPSSPDLVIVTSKLSMRRVNQNVRDL